MLNVMDQNIGQPGSNESKGNVQVSRKGTTNGEKSNKCNQCDFQTLPRVKIHKLSLLSVFKLLWILSKLGSSRPSVAGLLA